MPHHFLYPADTSLDLKGAERSTLLVVLSTYSYMITWTRIPKGDSSYLTKGKDKRESRFTPNSNNIPFFHHPPHQVKVSHRKSVNIILLGHSSCSSTIQ